MSGLLTKQNPIIFLLFLLCFSAISFFVAETINGSTVYVQEVDRVIASSMQSLSPSTIGVVQERVLSDNDIVAIPTDNFAKVEIAYNSDGTAKLEQVLGCGVGGSEDGCTAGNGIKYQPICSRGDVSIVVGDGEEVGRSGDSVKVTKNSKIEVWTVTVPMALLSGSEYVKDSRMAIGNADEGFQGTFKPAYDIITDHEARAFCVPGVNCKDFDEDIGQGPMEAYYVNVHAELEEEPLNMPPPDKAIIKPQLNSVCPDVQRSKPNPIKSNRKGTFVEGNFQLPGQHAFGRSFSSLVCMRSNPNGVETNFYEACLENRTTYDFLVYAQVQIDNWLECTVGVYDPETQEFTPPDPELCKKSVLTSLKIDGLFGSTFKCLSKNCASRYMDLTRQGILPPGMASARAPEDLVPQLNLNQPVVEPFYVSTPCMVRVDGIHYGEVPCLWDMSVYEADYERQKAAAGPGDPNMPATFELYWQMVEEQIKNRGQKC